MSKPWVTLVFGLLLLIASACFVAAFQGGGTYRRMLIHDPVTLDPLSIQDVFGRTVATQIFDGLVQFDSALRPVPAIAASWESSRDGLVWTFQLRHGALFHHGREVTAQDFVYSWTRSLATGTVTGRFFETLRQMRELRAVDRYTLRIGFAQPYAPLLSVLATSNAAVVPRELVEGREESFGVVPVGTGPFKLVKWDRGKEIVLVANDQYYEGRPFLDRVVFTVGGTFEEAFAGFLHGRFEDTGILNRGRDEAYSSMRYRRVRKPSLSLLYIGFNLRSAPFADVRVRQAFIYAVDTERIVHEVAQAAGLPASTVLGPGMPGYDPALRPYFYDVERARQLLAEAGYPKGEGFPIVNLWSSSKSGSAMAEMEAYKGYLAQIGVKVEPHYEPDWPTYSRALHDGKYDMFRLSWSAVIPDPDDFLMRQLHSHGTSNWSFYHDPDVDALLERAQGETDYERRVWFYHDVERRVMKDAPWLLQHYNVFDRLYQSYVRGVEVSFLGDWAIPMKNIWFEEMERE